MNLLENTKLINCDLSLSKVKSFKGDHSYTVGSTKCQTLGSCTIYDNKLDIPLSGIIYTQYNNYHAYFQSCVDMLHCKWPCMFVSKACRSVRSITLLSTQSMGIELVSRNCAKLSLICLCSPSTHHSLYAATL